MAKMKYGTEIEVSRNKAIGWFWITMLSLAVMIVLLLGISFYKQQDFQPESQKVPKSSQEEKTKKKLPPDVSNALGFEIIALRKRNSDDPQFAHVKVSVKITNISGKHIKNGEVTCVMQDDTGKNVAIQKKTVILEMYGGLAPGRSLYEDFTLYTYPLNMSSAICNTDNVTYYEQ